MRWIGRLFRWCFGGSQASECRQIIPRDPVGTQWGVLHVWRLFLREEVTFIRHFGDEEVDILSGQAKTTGKTSSDYEYEGELPKVYRRRLGLGLGVHCQPDPGLDKLIKGEDVGRTFALGNLDSSTRQLACFPKRWHTKALSDPRNDNDNALTWLLASSNRLLAEDEAACLCKSPRSNWLSHHETGKPIDLAKMCACAEEGREKEWEGGEDHEMNVKRRRRRQRKEASFDRH